MQGKNNVKRILLTGGGTGGSVSPLLAIVNQLKIKNYQLKIDYLFIGSWKGIEREMVNAENIKFKSIFCGKFRRYFSWRNFTDPFLILIGFFQALAVQLVWRPDIVISAGSFVSVPVVWAAWILRVPVLIHQQDVRPGLANKLMAPFARVVTVTFKESLKHYGKKAIWTGNMVRNEIRNLKFEIGELKKKFGLKENMPVVLALGGGTGAMAINELVRKGLDELTKFCQIIHITGKNKSGSTALKAVEPLMAYRSFEFLNAEQMAYAYAVADIVVSRCGMGVLTELSYLGKPSILIPIPDSHQEDNAKIFKEKDAAIVLDQKELTPQILVENIKNLINNKEKQNKISGNIQKVIKKGANEKIIKIIQNILK
jgi:UDP-N-acetylglucosamine--N-acetylmuramyl-(pentapeptide) pyrophosphoryl-undecaprenol N-acetylglucosamine transferase